MMNEVGDKRADMELRTARNRGLEEIKELSKWLDHGDSIKLRIAPSIMAQQRNRIARGHDAPLCVPSLSSRWQLHQCAANSDIGSAAPGSGQWSNGGAVRFPGVKPPEEVIAGNSCIADSLLKPPQRILDLHYRVIVTAIGRAPMAKTVNLMRLRL